MLSVLERRTLGSLPLTLCLHEIMYDAAGLPFDYKLLETNDHFINTFRLDPAKALGQPLSQWLFDGSKIPELWENLFAAAVNQQEVDFNQVLPYGDHLYFVIAYTLDSRHLITLFYPLTDSLVAKANITSQMMEIFSQRIFDYTPSNIVIYEVINAGESSMDYIIRGVNPAALKTENWIASEVIGQPLGLFRPGADEFGIIDVFRQVWQTGKTAHYPASVYQEGKETRWFENIIFKLPAGEIAAIYEEITESRLAAEALSAEKEKLKVTLYSIGDAVITTDVAGKIEMLNPVAENLTGWKQGEALGKPLRTVFDIYHESTFEPCENPVDKVLRTGKRLAVANHTILKARDGIKRAINNTAAPIKSSTGEILGVVLVFRDVTEAREKEERIRFLSYKDPLTGLYNRMHFEDEFKKMDSQEHYPLTLVMGDLDGLKLINDAFGPGAGDEALRKIADIMRQAAKPTAQIARWGGDEFVILLPNTTEEEAHEICAEIQKRASATTVVGTELRISLGCATRTDQKEQLRETLSTAEDNMCKAKLLGAKSYRNVVLASIKKTLFEKSDETEEHGRRVGKYSRAIGASLGLSAPQLAELEVFSMLHDIGKIGIDEQLLQKRGKLTEEEWQIIRKHPEIGYRIAHTVPELVNIADYILSHHERWDGKGYPRGLAGEEIPLLARILSVVDAYDAMTHDRSYRKALPESVAREELRKNAGTQFDPQIVAIFLEYLSQGEQQVN